MSYYGQVENPLTEALENITGHEPPKFTEGVFDDLTVLSDDQIEELQDWCNQHAYPRWSTGIGILEAAELIVREALFNGNIDEAPNKVTQQASRLEEAWLSFADKFPQSVMDQVKDSFFAGYQCRKGDSFQEVYCGKQVNQKASFLAFQNKRLNDDLPSDVSIIAFNAGWDFRGSCMMESFAFDHLTTLARSLAAEVEATTTGLTEHEEWGAPPLHIPDNKGGSYKTELVLSRSQEKTVKINWWHGPDPRRNPHNHPWPFQSEILSGGYTETRYYRGSGSEWVRTTKTYTKGDVNVMPANVYHTVDSVEPNTVTRMVCGELVSHLSDWGYLINGVHEAAKKDPEFLNNLKVINPHKQASPLEALRQRIKHAEKGHVFLPLVLTNKLSLLEPEVMDLMLKGVKEGLLQPIYRLMVSSEFLRDDYQNDWTREVHTLGKKWALTSGEVLDGRNMKNIGVAFERA